MKENIDDKLTRDLFENFVQDELPDDFTNRTMKRIMAEKPYEQQIKAFNPKAFIPAFIIVFAVIVLGTLFIPESSGQANQNYYLFSEFLKHLKISYPVFVDIKQLIAGSVVFKVLPFSVILLLMLDVLLSKKYQ